MSQENQTFEIANREELKAIYDRLFPSFPLRTIFLLSGEVGVGKTETVRIFAELWGLEQVSSPSFSIINEYGVRKQLGQGAQFGSLSLFHVDLYRLNDDADLESTGFWDLFANPTSAVVLEWADRIEPQFLPLDWQQVSIEIARIPEDASDQASSLKNKTSRLVTVKLAD